MRTTVLIPNESHEKAIEFTLYSDKKSNETFGLKVSSSIDIVDNIINIGLLELKNYFTIDEFKCMCNIFKRTLFKYDINPKFIIYPKLKDTYEIYGDLYFKKWNVNYKKLDTKVAALTITQIYALVTLINEFLSSSNEFIEKYTLFNNNSTEPNIEIIFTEEIYKIINSTKLYLSEFEGNDNNISDKASALINIADYILKSGFINIKDYFTVKEFECLCNIFKESKCSYLGNPRIDLDMSLGLYTDEYFKNYEVNRDCIYTKVRNLTLEQTYATRIFISMYWDKSKELDISKIFTSRKGNE